MFAANGADRKRISVLMPSVRSRIRMEMPSDTVDPFEEYLNRGKRNVSQPVRVKAYARAVVNGKVIAGKLGQAGALQATS